MKEVKNIREVQVPEIKPRRKFDGAFKRDAVALWVSSGKAARQIATELGIEERHLYLWKKSHAPATASTASQMQAELASLRRENALLRQQRDILKKLWVSSPIPRATLPTDRRLEKRAFDPPALPEF
jgi:transposase